MITINRNTHHVLARGVEGLVAKARGIRLRDPAIGYDGAAVLGWSLGGDVIRLLDPSA